MEFDDERSSASSRNAASPLTQSDFDEGLLRALDHSLTEVQRKLLLEREGRSTSAVKEAHDAVRDAVCAHRFRTLNEVQEWLARRQASEAGTDERQLVAKRFIWRLRQNVCSCPIYWGGRRSVGEI